MNIKPALSILGIAILLGIMMGAIGPRDAADASAGGPAIEFTAETMDGHAVAFPSDYKGKLVLLDFWATWCGPCMSEVPNIVRTYSHYHKQDFEILGVSLDKSGDVAKITSVMDSAGMTWPQIYDGNGWDAAIAKKYAVHSIPRALLVDGDSGKVLAAGHSLRGEGLGKAIEEALAAKKAARENANNAPARTIETSSTLNAAPATRKD